MPSLDDDDHRFLRRVERPAFDVDTLSSNTVTVSHDLRFRRTRALRRSIAGNTLKRSAVDDKPAATTARNPRRLRNGTIAVDAFLSTSNVEYNCARAVFGFSGLSQVPASAQKAKGHAGRFSAPRDLKNLRLQQIIDLSQRPSWRSQRPESSITNTFTTTKMLQFPAKNNHDHELP